MTTNSPATPLPWNASEYDEYGGYDCMTGAISFGPATIDASQYGQKWCEEISPEQLSAITQDAAYIVKSANAYPQLVEALRKATERISGEFCSHDGRCGPDTHDCYVREEMALLRSLGEA